ncbi:uncharacterized protein SPPG_03150 [Spizellomyces punctatus DAOM BR117]|uniref:Male-enhanced antigen 1 n=1 Tax=Spizellomyces punctatus (strain DAOM BR117) TaxID=645134 RepID=A0A0L0HJX4_SPIPD|nr:uncharacterized protein SPPG_03150 [Spizellomyces punctatus DAOM BR117]KND01338.1 hypothetical protein SPPG_03150 [Spizellomyces punctatus DAOM BR117]|eukprot:XP_016609377.1 hypothetical protein SPPG_03150 [Spizellomyces punctatus DAOM BR117]
MVNATQASKPAIEPPATGANMHIDTEANQAANLAMLPPASRASVPTEDADNPSPAHSTETIRTDDVEEIDGRARHDMEIRNHHDDFSVGNEPDSDEEEEEEYSYGYTPLNSGYEPLGGDADGEDEIDGQGEPTTLQSQLKAPEPLTITMDKNSIIDNDDLTIIQSVMSTITIPESAIPEWAKAVPEEQWLPKLIIDCPNTSSDVSTPSGR